MERRGLRRIALAVLLQFRNPKIAIALRHRGSPTIWMAMPKASVHKDRPTPVSVGYVGRPREFAVSDTKAKPGCVKFLAHQEFNGSIRLRHTPEALGRPWIGSHLGKTASSYRHERHPLFQSSHEPQVPLDRWHKSFLKPQAALAKAREEAGRGAYRQ